MTVMTSRERMQRLFAKDIPDKMGLFDHFWPETIDDYWPKAGYPKGANTTEFFNYDLYPGPWSVDTALFPGQEEILEETEEWKITKNGNGAVLKYWKHKSGTPEHIDFTIVTPEKWAEVKPSLLNLDTSRINVEECKEFAAKARAGDRFWTFGGCLHFELMRATLGDVCMLESLLLEPDWITDYCQTYTDFFIRHFTYVFDEVGLPDGMFVYEDLGFSNGPFCSPELYRKLIFPQHKQLFDFFHDRGLPIIFHTCGDVRKMMPHLIEVGIDCLQPMEAKAGMDVIELADTYPGQLSYMGNVDVTVLNTNDPEKVRDHVTQKLDALLERGVPYIFHSDHSIPPDVEMKTYQLALDILKEKGVYNGRQP